MQNSRQKMNCIHTTAFYPQKISNLKNQSGNYLEKSFKKTCQVSHKLFNFSVYKAALQQVSIFFGLKFLPWEFLLIKKLEIEKTKTA